VHTNAPTKKTQGNVGRIGTVRSRAERTSPRHGHAIRAIAANISRTSSEKEAVSSKQGWHGKRKETSGNGWLRARSGKYPRTSYTPSRNLWDKHLKNIFQRFDFLNILNYFKCHRYNACFITNAMIINYKLRKV